LWQRLVARLGPHVASHRFFRTFTVPRWSSLLSFLFSAADSGEPFESRKATCRRDFVCLFLPCGINEPSGCAASLDRSGAAWRGVLETEGAL
ncbi:MAG: hypothetical protein ACE5FA_01495, partial [Dehalococcoidia bacterium]